MNSPFAEGRRCVLPRTLLLLVLLIWGLPVVSVRAEVALSLDISGLPAELKPLVEESLALPASLAPGKAVRALWLERYLRRLPAEVHRLLSPYGYYHSRVDVDRQKVGENLRVQVRIEPGSPVRLVERRIELGGVAARENLQEVFPLRVGDILRIDRYEKGKAELLARLRDLGYLDAHYSRHQLRVDREKNRAWIELQIEPGERSRFGAARFKGGEAYPDRFLRRYLAFEEGEPFSYRLLGKTQKQLRDADRFQRVLVFPQLTERAGNRVPVGIELEPRPRFSLRPGVGYGTDTGARAALRFRDANAWHQGHEFKLDLLVAERLQNLTGSYAFPGYRNLDTGLNLHGGYRAEQLDNYDNRYIFGEVEQTYGFGGGRVAALFVRAQYEQSDISADSVYNGFLMPGLRYNEVQLPATTGKGYGFRLNAEARMSHSSLLSNISFVQLLGSGDLLLPLPFSLPLTLNLRLQGAGSLVETPLAEMPASLRFFAGGDRSVRGYAYQSLGPRDDQGQVVGGKHMLSGSTELTWQFRRNWGVALFVDAGNAFDSWSDYELAVGAGAGLRYATPVGPVQIDLASPVASGDFSLRLHLGIGFGW